MGAAWNGMEWNGVEKKRNVSGIHNKQVTMAAEHMSHVGP